VIFSAELDEHWAFVSHLLAATMVCLLLGHPFGEVMSDSDLLL
jgi:hypothetical protein